MPTPPLSHPERALTIAGLWLVLCCSAAAAVDDGCPVSGSWVLDGVEGTHSSRDVLDHIEGARIILLGESHDRPEDHRWQLHTLAALHSRYPDLRIGFEMFQRGHQDDLNRWVEGKLTEAKLLENTNWFENWGFPSELYAPMLHFARMHQRPAHALNVDRKLVSRVGEDGWDALPSGLREEIGEPAAIPDAYRERLEEVVKDHPVPDGIDDATYLERFLRAQNFWDRVMAKALAEAAESGGPVVGLVGRGHMEYGHGIPHQLADLGITEVAALLPHRSGEPCLDESPPIADALFGVSDGPSDMAMQPMRLGIEIETGDKGLKIIAIRDESVAEHAGLRPGDVITGAAGREIRRRSDLLALLDRQRPGNAVLLNVRRNGKTRDLLATFPPE